MLRELARILLGPIKAHHIFLIFSNSFCWMNFIMIIIMSKNESNKPDRATMRPGCVFACIDHVIYME